MRQAGNRREAGCRAVLCVYLPLALTAEKKMQYFPSTYVNDALCKETEKSFQPSLSFDELQRL